MEPLLDIPYHIHSNKLQPVKKQWMEKKKKIMRKTYTYACHQAGLQTGIESSIKEDWYAVQFTIIVKTLDKINNTCMFKIIGMTLFPGTLAL